MEVLEPLCNQRQCNLWDLFHSYIFYKLFWFFKTLLHSRYILIFIVIKFSKSSRMKLENLSCFFLLTKFRKINLRGNLKTNLWQYLPKICVGCTYFFNFAHFSIDCKNEIVIYCICVVSADVFRKINLYWNLKKIMWPFLHGNLFIRLRPLHIYQLYSIFYWLQEWNCDHLIRAIFTYYISLTQLTRNTKVDFLYEFSCKY